MAYIKKSIISMFAASLVLTAQIALPAPGMEPGNAIKLGSGSRLRKIPLPEGSVLKKSKITGREEAENIFIQANRDFKEQNYSQAIAKYQSLVDSRFFNGFIFYNLGNGYFRLNQFGMALANYERAKYYLPRDPDLDYNIRFTNQKIVDIINREKPIFSEIFFWLDSVTLKETFWVFFGLNFILFGLLAFRIFSRHELLFYGVLMGLVFWTLGGSSLLWKRHTIYNDWRVVVTSKEVKVHSGPDDRETVLFKLHDGAVVDQIDSEERWVLIEMPDGKKGWVRKSHIEIIRFLYGNNI